MSEQLDAELDTFRALRSAGGAGRDHVLRHPAAGADLREAISRDWEPAPPMPHPARPDGAPLTARRRAALSARFPGDVLVVPAGTAARPRRTTPTTRSAPTSSFTWLTGETVDGAVLVMTPRGDGHESVLYVREYAQRRRGRLLRQPDARRGVGRQRPEHRRHRRRRSAPRHAAWPSSPTTSPRTATTSAPCCAGVDPIVDALLPRGTGERLAQVHRRAAAGQGRMGDRAGCGTPARPPRAASPTWSANCPTCSDRPDMRGERWLEGTFWRRARLEGNEVGYTSIVGAGRHATTLHWWRNHGTITPATCCSPTWASRPTSSTPPTSPARCPSTASGRPRSCRSTARCSRRRPPASPR